MAGLAGPLPLLRNEDHTIRDTFFDRFSKATPLSVDGFPEDDINQAIECSTRTPGPVIPKQTPKVPRTNISCRLGTRSGASGPRTGPAQVLGLHPRAHQGLS